MRRESSAEFDWWFRASYPSVVRTAYLVLGDRSRAEEVAQDAFLKMLLNWSTVGRYERPDAWARKVAVRMAVRLSKRDRMREDREQLSLPPVDPPVPDPDLARAIAQLSPMQRAAVVLYYWEDLPVFDVARLLDVSESTVKQHLFRARTRLADLLGEEVGQDAG